MLVRPETRFGSTSTAGSAIARASLYPRGVFMHVCLPISDTSAPAIQASSDYWQPAMITGAPDLREIGGSRDREAPLTSFARSTSPPVEPRYVSLLENRTVNVTPLCCCLLRILTPRRSMDANSTLGPNVGSVFSRQQWPSN